MGTGLVLMAFCSGGLAVWLWVQSTAEWRAYQTSAYEAGVIVYNALQNGTAPPAGVTLRKLSATDQRLARDGAFRRLGNAPARARLTNVPLLADSANPQTGRALSLAILSPDLVYRLADLPRREGQTAAETLGEVFRLLASYCSDPFVVARMGRGDWVQLEAAAVWNCASAPRDFRLLGAGLAIVMIGILMTVVLNASADFSNFAKQLRSRRHLGGPTRYESPGPLELQEIVGAVNSYLETERAKLESRAAVLSGVSHDLGTPATRLRLRTALISDAELRGKLEADIDSMTGMIESVLTYTRAEMSAEEPRKLSLSSLLDAIVADYADTGSAVTFQQADDVIVQGGRSVFMSRQGYSVVVEDRDVTVTARPISLERAICNLVDNALKYGHRATVSLETDAQTATIIVQDAGAGNSALEMAALMAPFKRGRATTTIDGYGLGLTIVATIANLHGGALRFEDGDSGLRACLTIRR